MARQTLEQWVREALNDKDKDHPCDAMALVHKTGMQEKEIHTVKFGASPRDPKDLADLFERKAESYCQDIHGVQTFNLVAFYGGKPQAHHPFLKNGDPEGQYGLATESPTPQGQIQQMQRQAEMLFQQTYRRQQMQDERMDRILDMLVRENVSLRRENLDAVGIVKEVILERANNAHEHRMKELEYQRSSEERKKWIGFAPAVVNMVLGREVFPQSLADTALVETIAESLSPDDVMKIGAVLKPEAMGPLMARFEKYMVDKRLSQEKSRELTALVKPESELD